MPGNVSEKWEWKKAAVTPQKVWGILWCPDYILWIAAVAIEVNRNIGQALEKH